MRASSRWPLCPCDMFPLFSEHFHTILHKILQAHITLSLPKLSNQPLFQGATFSLSENWSLVAKMRVLSVLVAIAVTCFRPLQWTELGNIHLHTKAYTFTSPCTTISICLIQFLKNHEFIPIPSFQYLIFSIFLTSLQWATWLSLFHYICPSDQSIIYNQSLVSSFLPSPMLSYLAWFWCTTQVPSTKTSFLLFSISESPRQATPWHVSVSWIVVHQKIGPLKTSGCDFIWNKSFCSKGQDLQMRPSWNRKGFKSKGISGFICREISLQKTGNGRHRDTQEREPCVDRGRDWIMYLPHKEC